MSEPFDADEERTALALDREIDDLIAGRRVPSGDPALGLIAAAVRVDPPPGLASTVAATQARHARRQLAPLRVVAALMAYLFLSHGIGNLVNSAWVARNIGEPDSPHFATEGGLALIAVGLVVAAAVVWPRWMPAAATAGVPLGLAFGVLGAGEVGEFAAGAVLHLSQFAVAVLLAAGTWRARRHLRALRDAESP